MNTRKWDNIPWVLLEKYIFQIQKRIYYAEKNSDNRHVYLLQNKLSESWSFKTKIVSESFFFKKNTYEKELLQNLFPFFSNNDNIRKKLFSFLFRTKPFFSENQHQKKQKKFFYLFSKRKKNEKTFSLFKRPSIFLKKKTLVLFKNLKKKEGKEKRERLSHIFFSKEKKKEENKKNSFLSTKLIFNLENCKKQKMGSKISREIFEASKFFQIKKFGTLLMKLNNNFSITSFLDFSDMFKKEQIVEKFFLNNTERKKKFKELFFSFYPENDFYEKKSKKKFLRWSKVFWIQNTLFKCLQNSFFYFFVQKKKNNIILNNLVFKNTILLIIENKKKMKINNNKRKKIFFKEKIDFYRKYTHLEKKIKYLLQIFYLTKNLSYLETPLLLIQKNNKKILKKYSLESDLNKKKPIFSFFSKEKNKTIEIKKIFQLIQIKKQIEPQWKARYECYEYSLNRGSSAFNKIQAIFQNLRDEPKFFLKIEIKSLAGWTNEFKNFIYLLKNFFFYGLEKAFFHILKKQHYNAFCPLFEQILIFDKNQIIISHNNAIFLKKFSQFLLKNLEKNIFSSNIDNSNFSLKKSLSSIQTQIVHSFIPYERNSPGIDFLGFHITQSNKKTYLQKNIDLEYFKKPIFNITKLKIQTFITPSLSNVRSHLVQIRTIIKQSKTSTQELLINRLSPKIRGWSKFYSQLSFFLNKQNGYQKAANYCDYLTVKMLWRWACRRHPKKNRKWIKLKYFKTLHGKNWVFCVAKKQELLIKNFSNKDFSSAHPLFSYLCLPLHCEI